MNKDIKVRTFDFALRIIKVSKLLYTTRENRIVANQLFRSGTSVGSNVEEAVASYSRDEYTYKMCIALKEGREVNYWLRLIEQSGLIKPSRMKLILNESEEIKKILGSIVSKLKNGSKTHRKLN